MVGALDDFVIAERRTIPLQPSPDKRPRDDGVENPAQAEDRQLGLAGDRARVKSGNQVQAMLRGLTVQIRPARDKLINARQSSR